MQIPDDGYAGMEAQEIYYQLRNNEKAMELTREVLSATYAVHAGAAAARLVEESFNRLLNASSREQVDEVFAYSRGRWQSEHLNANMTNDKEGAWYRSLLVAGLNEAAGHVVDMGNHNNGFGNFLLRCNPKVTKVTGVDHRADPEVLTGDNLHFARQEDVSKVPLDDASADTVAFRVSLHHWPKRVQESLLKEAVRVLRPGGRIVIVEDSWMDQPGLTDNVLTQRFHNLSEADKLATLALIDVSSCFFKEETVWYTLSYRSAQEWANMLTRLGASAVSSTYWGFTLFTIYGAPMTVLRATMV